MKSLLSGFFLLCCWNMVAQAETTNSDTIHWYVNNFPPLNILAGPDRGRGWGDARIQIVSKRMPAFRHEIIESSGTRMFEDMKIKPNVCSPNLFRTIEREAYIEFSEPFSWIIPNGVLTTRTRYAQLESYLDANGALRLEDVLKNGKHKIGIIASRSYGKGIDTVLKKNAGTPAVVVVPSVNYPAGRLLKLIMQGEYDLIPGYAVELRYLAREIGLNEKDYVFLTVAEESQLVPTYVGCSKSELGKRAITAVNKLIADEQVGKEDAAAYRFWLDDRTSVQYDRLRKQVVLNGGK